MLNRLRWWWFQRQNGYPCREEIKAIMPKIVAAYYDMRLSETIKNIAICYAYYGDLLYVATEFKVTRERVRQCLLKAKYRAFDAATDYYPSGGDRGGTAA